MSTTGEKILAWMSVGLLYTCTSVTTLLGGLVTDKSKKLTLTREYSAYGGVEWVYMVNKFIQPVFTATPDEEHVTTIATKIVVGSGPRTEVCPLNQTWQIYIRISGGHFGTLGSTCIFSPGQPKPLSIKGVYSTVISLCAGALFAVFYKRYIACTEKATHAG